jgi:hypothetical protein
VTDSGRLPTPYLTIISGSAVASGSAAGADRASDPVKDRTSCGASESRLAANSTAFAFDFARDGKSIAAETAITTSIAATASQFTRRFGLSSTTDPRIGNTLN